MGVAGYGMLSIVILNGSLFNMLTSWGSDAGLLYYSASKKISVNKILRILRYILLLQLFVLGIVEFIYFSTKGHYWIIDAVSIYQWWLLPLFVLSISLTEKFSSLLNGLGKFMVFSKVQLYSNLVILGVFVFFLLWHFNFSIEKWLMLYIICMFLQAVAFMLAFYFVQNKKKQEQEQEYLSIPSKRTSDFFRYSFLTFFTNSIQFLAYRADFWIVEYYHGEKELGWYSLSVKLAQFFWILPLVYAGMIYPLVATGKKELSEQKLVDMLRILLVINIVGAIFSFFGIRYIIPLLFGSEFTPSVASFQLILPGVTLFTGVIIFAAYFAGVNQLWVNFWGSVLCLFIVLFFDFLLIPDYASSGAAIASSIAYSCAFVYYIIVFTIKTKITWKNIFVLGKSDWEECKLFLQRLFKSKEK